MPAQYSEKLLEPYKGWVIKLLGGFREDSNLCGEEIGIAVAAYWENTELITQAWFHIALWHGPLNKGDHPTVISLTRIMRDHITSLIDDQIRLKELERA